MLTYAIMMTFVCGILFGVLLTLSIAEFIRRYEAKKTFQKSAAAIDQHLADTPATVLDYSKTQ